MAAKARRQRTVSVKINCGKVKRGILSGAVD
jgi:hypothetical protein